MMIRHIAGGRVFLLMGSFAWLLVTAAAGALPPVSSRPERLRFEPETSHWSELPRPDPGTDIGDLAAARSDFSKGSYKKARKKVKRWLKSYGPSSLLLPQAILLHGQSVHRAHRAHLPVNPRRQQSLVGRLSSPGV